MKRHTFTAKVVNEQGWIHKAAFVAVRTFSKSSQDTGLLNESGESYALSCSVEAVAYTANYWMDEETQKAGKKSVPLCDFDSEDGGTLLDVDLTTSEAIQIMNSGLPSMEVTFKLVESDVNRRANQST